MIYSPPSEAELFGVDTHRHILIAVCAGAGIRPSQTDRLRRRQRGLVRIT
jgi:hypothetical protein